MISLQQIPCLISELYFEKPINRHIIADNFTIAGVKDSYIIILVYSYRYISEKNYLAGKIFTCFGF